MTGMVRSAHTAPLRHAAKADQGRQFLAPAVQPQHSCTHLSATLTPPAPADAASVVVGMRAGVGRVAVGCCVGIDAVTWPCHLLVAASSSLADFRARRHACGRLSRAAPACERSAGRPGRMPTPPRALSGVAGVLWGDSVKLCVGIAARSSHGCNCDFSCSRAGLAIPTASIVIP